MKRAIVLLLLSLAAHAQTINLPSGKPLGEVPGTPRRTNSFPTAVALSPDQRYLAILNNGFGTQESAGQQSIAILNLDTNELTDFPDPRLGPNAKQTYFLGLAWSTDGRELYASMASLTDPEGKQPGSTGNGIAVYSFAEGKLTPARFLKIPLQPLAKGKKFTYGAKFVPEGFANPYPAGLTVMREKTGDALLVPNNLSDTVVLISAKDGRLLKRFDLSRGATVPSQFPYECALQGSDESKAWCTLWNGSALAELDLNRGRVNRLGIDLRHDGRAKAGSHPAGISSTGEFLFVALQNADEVAVIRPETGRVLNYIPLKFGDSKSSGLQPTALVADERGRLYVTLSGANALAVVDIPENIMICFDCDPLENLRPFKSRGVLGFIPTQWYPTAVAIKGRIHSPDERPPVELQPELLIATGKGIGTGPNSAAVPKSPLAQKGHPYIASLIHGSIARVNIPEAEKNLKELTQQVLDSNLMRQPPPINFGVGKNPIKHVIYVIKENRTYDQLFGDLKPGNGDPSLTLYGWDITPNHHKLALQFGILDNFYDSGEVSGNGHVWSTAATTSDYTEKTWQINYRGDERMYDYEGKVGDIYPMHEQIPDINEPRTGYLWANAARSGLTYRHYGEYVDTQWCSAEKQNSPASTGRATTNCERPVVRKGEPLPEHLGGGPSPWPWPVPKIADNIPTKPELVGHFDPHFADYRLEYPDQLRADEFLREFKQFVRAREKGKGEQLPNLVVLRLPNDHTAGTWAGMPTPSAMLADNDLALGRIVEAVSNSPYWEDTAILVLEDDAQDGADHVDAHRSIAFVISKYSQSATEKPVVDSTFHTTVSMIKTIEDLLGMPPMNNNDAQAAPIQLFGGQGTQPPYKADRRNLDNGLIYTVNQPNAQGSKESAAMDFMRADSVNTELLNAILWRDRKGDIPVPNPVHTVHTPTEQHDDDDDDEE